MIKLIRILEEILKSNLLYKSCEFKDGYAHALEVVKLHGMKTEIIQYQIHLENRVKFLEDCVNTNTQNTKDLLDKKNLQIQELNNRCSKLQSKADKNRESKLVQKEKDKNYKQRKILANHLLNKSLTPEERVSTALGYLNAIKGTLSINNLND